MNAEAIPAGQLACLLQDTAAGICADTAAIELIAGHGHFLHQPGFRQLIAAGSGISAGEPVAVIRWKAAIHAPAPAACPAPPPSRPCCGSPPASATPAFLSACGPSSAPSTGATSRWSPTRSPPPTADHHPPTRAGCAGPPAIPPSAPDLKGTRP